MGKFFLATRLWRERHLFYQVTEVWKRFPMEEGVAIKANRCLCLSTRKPMRMEKEKANTLPLKSILLKHKSGLSSWCNAAYLPKLPNQSSLTWFALMAKSAMVKCREYKKSYIIRGEKSTDVQIPGYPKKISEERKQAWCPPLFCTLSKKSFG